MGYCTVRLVFVSLSHCYLLYAFCSLFFQLIVLCFVIIRFTFVFLVCMFCFLFFAFCVSVLFCVLFLPMYIVDFLSVYNFTDHCHRVEIHLQLREITLFYPKSGPIWPNTQPHHRHITVLNQVKTQDNLAVYPLSKRLSFRCDLCDQTLARLAAKATEGDSATVCYLWQRQDVSMCNWHQSLHVRTRLNDAYHDSRMDWTALTAVPISHNYNAPLWSTVLSPTPDWRLSATAADTGYQSDRESALRCSPTSRCILPPAVLAVHPETWSYISACTQKKKNTGSSRGYPFGTVAPNCNRQLKSISRGKEHSMGNPQIARGPMDKLTN